MEHRLKLRHRIFSIIEIYNVETPRMTGMIYDFSLDGAFILCTIPPRLGKVVNIRLIAAPVIDHMLPVSGIVIHKNQHGFGMMFCEEQFEMVSTLDNFRKRCLITTYI